MTEFLAEHAGVAIAMISILVTLLGACVSIISFLLLTLLKQFTKSNEDLSAAIFSVQDEMKSARREAKEDREKDHQVVGSIFDRLSDHHARIKAIEVKCETKEEFCKNFNGNGGGGDAHGC